ncbi:MAG: type II toxin-antitoxin system VapC family toxin [Methylococcaceae bacterium]
MKYILDTHSFIWWHNNTSHLSEKVLAICENTDNELLLSMASIWKMQVKLQTNKLKLNTDLIDIITLQQANGISILPININHIVYLNNLPLSHDDCFDRLLVAQAIIEDAVIVSKDSKFKNYSVQTLW